MHVVIGPPRTHSGHCVVVDRRRTERQHALKLLQKVDLIVAEVAVRLQHLSKKAEDVAVDAENGEAEAATEAPESSLNSCACTCAHALVGFFSAWWWRLCLLVLILWGGH